MVNTTQWWIFPFRSILSWAIFVFQNDDWFFTVCLDGRGLDHWHHNKWTNEYHRIIFHFECGRDTEMLACFIWIFFVVFVLNRRCIITCTARFLLLPPSKCNNWTMELGGDARRALFSFCGGSMCCRGVIIRNTDIESFIIDAAHHNTLGMYHLFIVFRFCFYRRQLWFKLYFCEWIHCTSQTNVAYETIFHIVLTTIFRVILLDQTDVVVNDVNSCPVPFSCTITATAYINGIDWNKEKWSNQIVAAACSRKWISWSCGVGRWACVWWNYRTLLHMHMHCDTNVHPIDCDKIAEAASAPNWKLFFSKRMSIMSVPVHCIPSPMWEKMKKWMRCIHWIKFILLNWSKSEWFYIEFEWHVAVI